MTTYWASRFRRANQASPCDHCQQTIETGATFLAYMVSPWRTRRLCGTCAGQTRDNGEPRFPCHAVARDCPTRIDTTDDQDHG